jgi:MerR family mercuric resistance operon transcriptional regulator
MTERSIGELADAAGVNVETVRYYERRGLLPEPPRTPSGYRRYDDDALWRLEFVGRAKQLGFTLSEIRDLLGAEPTARTVDGVLRAAQAKLAEVDTKLANLSAQQCRLRNLVATCETGEDGCVTLEVETIAPTPSR